MHRYLRSIGFSGYRKEKELEVLLRRMARGAARTVQMDTEDGDRKYELRAETAPGVGVAMVGEMDGENFLPDYYFPYLEGSAISSDASCMIQRHTERETYAGLLDEYRVGISLIFYITNSMEYRLRQKEKRSVVPRGAVLSGLSAEGKILLPIQKTPKQIEDSKVEAKNRSRLIEAAKNGDEDAMETLTIEDIDMYSQISRRIVNEDIYSIIESCFMPCGVECDQYSVIGEITSIETKRNRLTDEEIYVFGILCNDMEFVVGINKQDLIGEPQKGRRFKGQIWMQGIIEFDS